MSVSLMKGSAPALGYTYIYKMRQPMHSAAGDGGSADWRDQTVRVMNKMQQHDEWLGNERLHRQEAPSLLQLSADLVEEAKVVHEMLRLKATEEAEARLKAAEEAEAVKLEAAEEEAARVRAAGEAEKALLLRDLYKDTAAARAKADAVRLEAAEEKETASVKAAAEEAARVKAAAEGAARLKAAEEAARKRAAAAAAAARVKAAEDEETARLKAAAEEKEAERERAAAQEAARAKAVAQVEAEQATARDTAKEASAALTAAGWDSGPVDALAAVMVKDEPTSAEVEAAVAAFDALEAKLRADVIQGPELASSGRHPLPKTSIVRYAAALSSLEHARQVRLSSWQERRAGWHTPAAAVQAALGGAERAKKERRERRERPCKQRPDKTRVRYLVAQQHENRLAQQQEDRSGAAAPGVCAAVVGGLFSAPTLLHEHLLHQTEEECKVIKPPTAEPASVDSLGERDAGVPNAFEWLHGKAYGSPVLRQINQLMEDLRESRPNSPGELTPCNLHGRLESPPRPAPYLTLVWRKWAGSDA